MDGYVKLLPEGGDAGGGGGAIPGIPGMSAAVAITTSRAKHRAYVAFEAMTIWFMAYNNTGTETIYKR
ncbi:hypothetical protein ACFXTH_011503 [Malus domestica]